MVARSCAPSVEPLSKLFKFGALQFLYDDSVHTDR
jgi:hypothetical protein